jgi:hypothetical protein
MLKTCGKNYDGDYYMFVTDYLRLPWIDKQANYCYQWIDIYLSIEWIYILLLPKKLHNRITIEDIYTFVIHKTNYFLRII